MELPHLPSIVSPTNRSSKLGSTFLKRRLLYANEKSSTKAVLDLNMKSPNVVEFNKDHMTTPADLFSSRDNSVQKRREEETTMTIEPTEQSQEDLASGWFKTIHSPFKRKAKKPKKKDESHETEQVLS